MLHSRGAGVHQVEQPLLVRRLLWPVDFQDGGFGQALSQIYNLQVEVGGSGWWSLYSFIQWPGDFSNSEEKPQLWELSMYSL